MAGFVKGNAPSVLVRCDGSPTIGLGHVARCLALADELRGGHGCEVTFAMREGPAGPQIVRDKGYAVIPVPDHGQDFEYGDWINRAIDVTGASALILDVRDDLPRAAVQGVRERGVVVTTIDDPSDRRIASDLAFYPPVPQVQRLDWRGFTGRLYVGWEWVVLRREFARRAERPSRERPVILVTMGGSDPAGLTARAVKALERLEDPFDTIVLLGPAFGHDAALAHLLATARRRFELRRHARDVAAVMAEVDLAVASFGVTAYELAAMEVPAIYLCLSDDHVASAAAFVEAGVAHCLGRHDLVADSDIALALARALANPDQLRRMRAAALHLIDGRGAARAAQVVAQRIVA